MADENKKPETILDLLEQRKGSFARIIEAAWEATKSHALPPELHFIIFHQSLMRILAKDFATLKDMSMDILADHLVPLLTDEEKEALHKAKL